MLVKNKASIGKGDRIERGVNRFNRKAWKEIKRKWNEKLRT
jgi:hypothetical protein